MSKIGRTVQGVIFPALVFILITEICALVLSLCLSKFMAGAAGTSFGAYIEGNEGTVSMLISEISIFAGICFYQKQIRWEIGTAVYPAKTKADLLKKHQPGKYGAFHVLLGLGTLFLSAGLNIMIALFLMPAASDAAVESISFQNSVPTGAGLLFYAVISPVLEESFFRGLLYNRLRQVWGRENVQMKDSGQTRNSCVRDLNVPAAVISALLFGFYHGNSLQLVYAFLMGFVFACVYEKTGDLRVPMFLHGLSNAFVLLLSGLPVYEMIAYPAWGAALSAAGLLIFFLCLHSAPNRNRIN